MESVGGENVKYIFLFPGQGTQYSGMFNVIRMLPDAVNVYEQANEILGYDLKGLCTTGNPEQLQQTEFTQAAIFTHSMALYSVLRKNGIEPYIAAGHSVGEFSALVAAGVLSFEDALRLVQKRGKLMASVQREGSMVSVVGLSLDEIHQLFLEVKEKGYIAISLHNTQNQFVMSGDAEAVEAFSIKAKEKGALKVVKLKVSQAFHSELMREIHQEFIEEVDKLSFGNAQCPIILNCTAEKTSEAEKIKEDIRQQLVSPVRWYDSVQKMLEEEAEFVEVGPGKSLSGMLRSIDKGRKAVITDAPRELAKLLKMAK